MSESHDLLLRDLDRLGTLLERSTVTITFEVQHLLHPGVDDLGVEDLGVDDLGVDDLGVDDLGVDDLGGESNVVALHGPIVSTPGAARGGVRRLVAAVAVAAAVIGALWVASDRPGEQRPATNPPSGPLRPSASIGRIENFPLLDAGDVPIALTDDTIVGTWANSTEDQGWSAFYGVPADESGVPTSVIEVSMFPASTPRIADAQPGRSAGVTELAWDGGSTIQWVTGDHSFTIAGADIDQLYALQPLIQPVTGGSDGFAIVGEVPAPLVQLEAPRHHPAMWSPGLSSADDSGAINLYVYDLSLNALLVTGDTDIARVQIGSYPGSIGSRDGHVDLAFSVATDETVYLSSSALSRDQLIEVARKVRFTDESTWREHYGIDWGGDAASPTTAAAIEVSSTMTVPDDPLISADTQSSVGPQPTLAPIVGATTTMPSTTCAGGASTTTVPDVVTAMFDQASVVLAAVGLVAQSAFELTPVGSADGSDLVLRQRVLPGVSVPCGTVIELIVPYDVGPLYEVRPGDTYASIAATLGIPIGDLLAYQGEDPPLAADLATRETPLELGQALRTTPLVSHAAP